MLDDTLHRYVTALETVLLTLLRFSGLKKDFSLESTTLGPVVLTSDHDLATKS